MGLLLLALIFAPALTSGPFWDDINFIFNAPGITANLDPFAFWKGTSGFTKAWPLGHMLFLSAHSKIPLIYMAVLCVYLGLCQGMLMRIIDVTSYT